MRQFRFLALFIALVALLAACGSDDDDEPPTATAKEQAAVTTTTAPTEPPSTPMPEPTAPPEAAPATATHAYEGGDCEILFAADIASDPTGHRIYCTDADGTGLHPLTDAPDELFDGEAYEGNPTWSPDGTQVAFIRTGPDGGVFIVHADGTGERRILDGWAWPADWSPDGSQLVLSWREGGWPLTIEDTFQIVALDTGGANLTVLNDAPDLQDRPVIDMVPEWSPDGTRILFQHWTHSAQAEDDTVHLYIVNADGSNLHRVETGNVVSFDGTWAPDSNALIVGGAILDDPNPSGIFLLPLDGREPERLTPPDFGLLIGTYDVSPDGSRIAYASNSQETDDDIDPETIAWDLFVLEIGSNTAQAITQTPDEHEISPFWSPDGEQLIYVVERYGMGPEHVQLAVINADGTHPLTLVESLSIVGQPTSPPVWRPVVERGGLFVSNEQNRVMEQAS